MSKQLTKPFFPLQENFSPVNYVAQFLGDLIRVKYQLRFKAVLLKIKMTLIGKFYMDWGEL